MVDCEGNKLHDCDIVQVNLNNKVAVFVLLKGRTWRLDGTRLEVTDGFIKRYSLKRVCMDERGVIAIRKKRMRFCNKCEHYEKCDQNMEAIDASEKYANLNTAFVNDHCPYYAEYYLQSLKDKK